MVLGGVGRSAIWFLGHGQSVGAGTVAISVTPLLLLLVFVYIAVPLGPPSRGDGAAARRRGRLEPGRPVGRRAGLCPGYGLVSAVFALFTLGGPATPGVAAVSGRSRALAALGFVLLRPDDETAPAFVRRGSGAGPTWLPTVWRTGWRGAGQLLALGLVVVVLRLVVSWSAVADIQDQYAANVGALVIIALAQLALLGNAATWALSFLSGPGFQVALGSTVSPAAAQPGLLPLVPVLGALPEAATTRR